MQKSSHTSYHTVQFHETDMAGFAHFPQAFLWAEKAELEFMKDVDLPLIETKAGTMNAWPRVHVEANYTGPLRFEDNIAICINIEAIGTHSIAYSIEIFKLERSEWISAAQVKMKTVYVTGAGPGLSVKKQPIPEEILKKITTATKSITPPAPNK